MSVTILKKPFKCNNNGLCVWFEVDTIPGLLYAEYRCAHLFVIPTLLFSYAGNESNQPE